MSYRHPHWYATEAIKQCDNPHVHLLLVLLAFSWVPLNFFLAVLLGAIGFAELWIPLVCIQLVGVFLYRWYK